MTELKKPVRRKTVIMTDNRKKARARDKFTVTLYPDNTIGFRENRSRTEHRLPLAECFALAVKRTDEIRRREKTRRRKLVKRGLLSTP